MTAVVEAAMAVGLIFLALVAFDCLSEVEDRFHRAVVMALGCVFVYGATHIAFG